MDIVNGIPDKELLNEIYENIMADKEFNIMVFARTLKLMEEEKIEDDEIKHKEDDIPPEEFFQNDPRFFDLMREVREELDRISRPNPPESF